MEAVRKTIKIKPGWVAGLLLGGIALNTAGAQIAAATGIVLYLDSVGTVIAAALGGFLPGVLVGFITNLIKTLTDAPSIYYGVINVLIAIFAAFFARRGFFNSLPRLIVPILSTGLIVGAASSVLTWYLYGFATEGITAELAASINEHSFLGHFGSQIAADVSIDLCDKAITFLIAFIAFKLIPERIQDNFIMTYWQQKPLSGNMLKTAHTSSIRKLSLRAKILLVLIPSMTIIAISATLISYQIYVNNSRDDQAALAYTIAQVAVNDIDATMIDEYLENGKAAPGYNETLDQLKGLMKSSDDIEYIYVYRMLEDGCHVVFDTDPEGGEASEPGYILPYSYGFIEHKNELLEGEPIDPVITDDEYGWLMSVYVPVYVDSDFSDDTDNISENKDNILEDGDIPDSNKKCVCYVCVDISMDSLQSSAYTFLAKLFSLFFGLFIVILVVGLWLTEYHIILPTNSISYSVSHFAHDSKDAMEEHVRAIHELGIVTGDEVENLYLAVSKMADDDLAYMLDIQKKNATIMQMQSGLIMILADIVESRDKCTGDHVRKTAEYTGIIMKHMKKLDIYSEDLTDEFVENVYNSAPLHDVGKIHVSDAILNKPGKLDDDEYAIMKEHTTVGAEIIERAIELVPDTGYLHEARNLALYHHEKWDGSGYPMGLSGENIPLSARIMAIADVFDALVSKRSYKDGMPFEKAMSIIREGAGSHFDAEIVKAFEDAEDEVREVAESFKPEA
ncbi:MAG: HD domain-containing protein [Eubacterium sp.]|nr:HD domain-containing protein [Eubacterium sp.]